MFKLNAKFDEYSLLYSLSHFEFDGHTVYNMLIQQCLPPPLTSTVKSSLFTHAHFSPLSLAARLHWCHTNHSHYINNGWPFLGQTSYVHLSKWEENEVQLAKCTCFAIWSSLLFQINNVYICLRNIKITVISRKLHCSFFKHTRH